MSDTGGNDNQNPAAPTQAADEARAAENAAVDQDREVARQAFEMIKSARSRTTKKVD